MVLTTLGKELARVAVVDYWTEGVLLDTFVKPVGEVVDYLTEYVLYEVSTLCFVRERERERVFIFID